MKVADAHRYRNSSSNREPLVRQAGSGGSEGSGFLRGDEKKAETVESLREAYEERAAILEYDAGMSRDEAEALARKLTGYEGA